MECVVRIYSLHEGVERFCGSGFLVHRTSGGNLVMTCHHSVELITNALICFPDGNRFDARLNNWDEHTDLALLRYVDHGSSPNALRFARSHTSYVGRVYLIAYFLLMDGSIPTQPGISSSEIIGPPKCLWGTGPCENISDYTSQEGTSGGPLMNSQDEVIGVHRRAQWGIKAAVTLDTVHLTLAAWSNTRGGNLEISEMLGIIAAQDP